MSHRDAVVEKVEQVGHLGPPPGPRLPLQPPVHLYQQVLVAEDDRLVLIHIVLSAAGDTIQASPGDAIQESTGARGVGGFGGGGG